MFDARSLVRQEKIVRILMELEQVSIQELATQLDVSTWTIRRDLAPLEERKVVRRFHGGVALLEATLFQQDDFESSVTEAREAKQRIGQVAARMLLMDDSIVLGGGATTTEVARHLTLRKNLRIMTNALNIALELSRNPNIHVTCTGGNVDGGFYTLIGSVTERSLSAHFFDVAVIGVSGISANAGLTVSSQANAIVLRLMIEHSRKTIVVAAHSKFEQICFAQVAPLSQIDTIVTDTCPPALLADELKSAKVRLLVADEYW